jgi:Gram-negative bacterial TonB protein C-terminal
MQEKYRLKCPRSVLYLLRSVLALAAFPFASLAQQAHILPLQLGAPVVGKPFAATRTLDYEPAAGSPDPVTFHAEEVFFRDSEGRTRSEIKYPGHLKTIDIIDFVIHLRYHWTDGDSVAASYPVKEVSAAPRPPERLPDDAPLVEGVPTRHTHSVTGKDHIESSVESWYSPDLGLALVTIIDKPGIGKTTYRFFHVSRGEPDPALFHVPQRITVENSKITPPSPPPVQAASSNQSPGSGNQITPNPIQDDNYLEALARFHAAVPRLIPSGNYHRHTEVRSIDIFGRETSATVDHWQKGPLARDEEQAPGWRYTTVWAVAQNWSAHEGISPLRLFSLSDLATRPNPAERRIRIYAQGYVAMKSRDADGSRLSCSGEFAGAEVCFDTATGFPASAAVDEERVVYEQWSQFGGAAYPGRVALYRGHRLQMEATTAVTPLDESSNDLFQPLPGVTPSPNRLGAYRTDKFRLLKGSQMDTDSHGEALVKVFVDKSGRVKNAELLDADDKSLSKAALTAAKQLVFMPQEVDGHRVPFETTFWMSHWSTPDPISFSSTSRSSQGTD